MAYYYGAITLSIDKITQTRKMKHKEVEDCSKTVNFISKHIVLPILIIHCISFSVLGLQFDLHDSWNLQSSAEVPQTGLVISTSDFIPQNWYPITVPSTVLAGLIANNIYPDPFYSSNLSAIPASQFDNSWWYRTEFAIPASESGKRIWLNFSGINYRANIWLNGQKLADSAQVVGAYRTYEFDVTDIANFGNDSNALAIEVFKPGEYDLSINFVDWAPHPPDLSMGLFKKAFIRTSGSVNLRHPHVITDLDITSLVTAKLSVLAELTNATASPVTGTLEGTISAITFSKEITLAAQEKKEVVLQHSEFPQLIISNPSIWWPWQMGNQPLYNCKLAFVINNTISDSAQIDFGIRKVTSRLVPVSDPKHRLFSVNGKDILLRGAGWCPDLFLRRNPKRMEAEIRYIRDISLNTIRLEGKLEEREFYDLCNKYGILVLPGWCCSAYGTGWENWKEWDSEDHAVAYASLQSQIYRHRFHPCMLAWMYGSDLIPPPDVEQAYLDILKDLMWPNPSMASATHRLTSTITGIPGGKMSGPYKWEPPIYWFQDSLHGGYFGFNTEAGPGAAVPPFESIKEFIPANDLWPINSVWNFHCGIVNFDNFRVFAEAVDNRYGPSKSVQEYCMKAQVAAYESHRVMFEAYSQNKYTSTGIIHWMLNNAWPSMLWHLYDYYLRPGGSYFGAKAGCKPLHIQYSVNDRNVVVVNSYYTAFSNLNAEAYVYTLDGEEKFHKQTPVSLNPDEVKKLFAIPVFDTISSTYFLKLTLSNENGEKCDYNSYWLSTIPDIPDWNKTTFHYTPLSSFGDLTALQNLDTVVLNYSYTVRKGAYEDTAVVSVNNPTSVIAFAVRLRLLKNSDKEEIQPVLWSDNYFVLYPHERRKIIARYNAEDAGSGTPELIIEGWNVKQGVIATKYNVNQFKFVLPCKYTCSIYNLLGRKIYEYSSKNHIKQAVSAFKSRNFNYWKLKLAAGVYIVKMKQFYNNGSKSVITRKIMLSF